VNGGSRGASGPIVTAAAALVLYIVLVLGNIASTSPTSDEIAHLAGGWSYFASGDYRINTEHPPLLKKLAALPLAGRELWPADSPRLQSVLREAWVMVVAKPMGQWFFAHHLFYGVRDATTARNGWTPLSVPTTAALAKSDYVHDTDAIFRNARTMMLLPGILLALVIFLWSRELWGWWGAAISTVLFCVDPNFIAHTGLVTTDVGASLFFVAAIWFFWRATRQFTWPNAIAFALCFALAQVSKYSAVLLLPMLLVLALHARKKLRDVAILIALAGVASIAIIWTTYGFRYTAVRDVAQQVAEETAVRTRLQDPRLEASDRMPSGRLAIRNTLEQAAATKALMPLYTEEPPFQEVLRAMRTTPLPLSAKIILFFNEHHLLPEAYLHGVSLVSLGGAFRSTYLHGEYTARGFTSYFFWTTLYKTPIPLLVLIVLGVWMAVKRRGAWLPFLVWPAAIYLFIAMTSSINIGHRHILPVFPFVYILCGALAARLKPLHGAIAAVLLVIPLFVVLPNAPMWGHHLSYMNELAGGPRNGWTRLVDSNLDWGQDLPALSRWMAENKITEPITLLYFGTADPQYHGIRFVNPPLGHFARPEAPLNSIRAEGWFAVSANSYNGFLFAPDSRDYWRRFLEEHGAQRVGSAGYSIFLYRFPR
jgi:4-amino-4-deoxy-L-arabinose transferase-like glycosyltransferase